MGKIVFKFPKVDEISFFTWAETPEERRQQAMGWGEGLVRGGVFTARTSCLTGLIPSDTWSHEPNEMRGEDVHGWC